MCKSKKFLSKTLRQIIGDGGEGVILRRPKSLYEHGRTPNLMKLKVPPPPLFIPPSLPLPQPLFLPTSSVLPYGFFLFINFCVFFYCRPREEIGKALWYRLTNVKRLPLSCKFSLPFHFLLFLFVSLHFPFLASLALRRYS